MKNITRRERIPAQLAGMESCPIGRNGILPYRQVMKPALREWNPALLRESP
ncbi:MAG: hypothetical protein ABIJ65_03200 [Chloroflexota bacterium]